MSRLPRTDVTNEPSGKGLLRGCTDGARGGERGQCEEGTADPAVRGSGLGIVLEQVATLVRSL